MGNREARERAEAGTVFRDGKLVSKHEIVRPVSDQERQQFHDRGEQKLKSMSTNKQIRVLTDSLHQGRLSKEYLRSTFEDSARKNMAKGAKRLRKKKKEVTVDALLQEYREPGNWELRGLCDELGLTEEWYMSLAASECVRELPEL